MSWCSDAPEDEVISLFPGLLANPDVPLSLPTNVVFIQIEILGVQIIAVPFGVEWVVNRVFTTRTKNLFLTFRFQN